MTFALGIELTAEAVRVATTTNGQVLDAPVEVVVPVLFIRPDGSVAVGGDALNLSAQRPQGLVTDIVGQFDVDRLFLTEGRMLTPDETLRELLAVVIGSTEQVRQGSAAAVTVACPVEWAAAVRERVERVMEGLGAARLHVMSGGDAARAAGDAFLRLPLPVAAETPGPREELPALDPGFDRPPPPPPRVSEPQRTRMRPQWIAVAVFVALLTAIVTWLGVVAVRNDTDNEAAASTSGRPFFDLTSRPAPPLATTTAPPPRPSAIGLVTTDDPDPAVTVAVDGAGPVLGQAPRLLTARAADAAGAAAAVASLRSQGAAAVLVDVAPGGVDAAVGAAGTDLAVCTTTSPTARAAGAAVVVATAGRCAEVLLLAVTAADDADPVLVADAVREIGAARGLVCETYDLCRRYLKRDQRIIYAPDGRPLRLLPSANAPR